MQPAAPVSRKETADSNGKRRGFTSETRSSLGGVRVGKFIGGGVETVFAPCVTSNDFAYFASTTAF
jgi:hypothetical protein